MILLQQNINEMSIEYLLGSAEELTSIEGQAPMAPFDEKTIDFLAAVSAGLRAAGRRDLVDITTLSFWCRKAHLNQLKGRYVRKEEVRLGRGVSLHFAPGNIPTQFAYTAIAGLLAGNCAVVRLSQKKTEQESIIINAFRRAAEGEFAEFKGRVIFLRYAHDAKVTEALSSLCDVRVIWGSDESVKTIRCAPLKAAGVDLPFAARDSAAVFSAKAVNETEDMTALCRDFYNDTYLNDQNACSSPHIIYWMGEKTEITAAKTKFRKAFKELLDERKYEVQAETAVRKLDAGYAAAVCLDGIKIEKEDNIFVRLQVEKADPQLWSYSQPGGFFMELQGEGFEEMAPVLTAKCQTVSTYGIDNGEFADFIAESRVEGVDRIVPVGHALDFQLTWDGFNMIDCMSRIIDK